MRHWINIWTMLYKKISGVTEKACLLSHSYCTLNTETWKANIDKGKVVGVIFIDFRKAFDCVDHEILGFKMQGCGISGNLHVSMA